MIEAFDVFKRHGLVVRTVHDIGRRQAFAHMMAGSQFSLGFRGELLRAVALVLGVNHWIEQHQRIGNRSDFGVVVIRLVRLNHASTRSHMTAG